MTQNRLAGLALIGMLLATPGFAMDYEEIVDRAVTNLDNEFNELWAFTETSIRDELQYEASYDPRRPENNRWELDSVDDRDPTGGEVESFLAQKSERDDDEPGDEVRVEATYQPDSLILLEETGDHWLFGFVPSEVGEHKAFMQHISGTLKVVKDGHYIEFFDLRSEAPFKPATGVKIKTFKSRLTFGPAAVQGPIVPISIDIHVNGRAYFAIRFDQTEKIRYQDYQFVGAN